MLGFHVGHNPDEPPTLFSRLVQGFPLPFFNHFVLLKPLLVVHLYSYLVKAHIAPFSPQYLVCCFLEHRKNLV